MALATLENVWVEFPIYSAGSRSLKKTLIQMGTGGRIRREDGGRVSVQALRDVSLHLDDGDRIGLVGANGAGKTTLLRVLARICEPPRGRVHIEGRVAALFDASLGMDVEATGYENITLRGLLLGLSLSEIRNKTEEIAEFTELGDYLDMPVHTYSSGMLLRLGFSVSTCVDPEILLMDEWISAGDAHFIEKAKRRMESFMDRSSIVVIASHSNHLIRRLCNKAVFLAHGEVKAIGPVNAILEQYKTAA